MVQPVTTHTQFDLNEWDEQIGSDDYFVIAHTLDRVWIGKEAEHHDVLRKAVRDNTLLEAHFFNEQREIFVSKFNQKLIMYTPLEHRKVPNDEKISRSYKLDKTITNQVQNKGSVGGPYKVLEVIEYLKYDKDTHLAYVDQSILYCLKKG